MNRIIPVTIALVVGGLTGYGGPAGQGGYQVVNVSNGGTIAGTVTFDGSPPTVSTVKTTKDQDVCGETVPDPNATVVNPANRGIRWVIAYLEGITEGKAPTEEYVLDNEDCSFQPHVMGAVEGKRFVLENSDPVLHNTHIYLGRRTLLNSALSFHKGDPMYMPITNTRVLRRSGQLTVQCDAHEWMSSHVIVLEHPYFDVTNGDGTFRITDVPPGTYTLKTWHENLGQQSSQVTVEAGKETRANLTFKGSN